jgi:hypothetical protein
MMKTFVRSAKRLASQLLVTAVCLPLLLVALVEVALVVGWGWSVLLLLSGNGPRSAEGALVFVVGLPFAVLFGLTAQLCFEFVRTTLEAAWGEDAVAPAEVESMPEFFRLQAQTSGGGTDLEGVEETPDEARRELSVVG